MVSEQTSGSRAARSAWPSRPVGVLLPVTVLLVLVILAMAPLAAGRGASPAPARGDRVAAGSAEHTVLVTVHPSQVELRTLVSVLVVGVALALALFSVDARMAPRRRAPRARAIPVRGRAPPAPRTVFPV